MRNISKFQYISVYGIGKKRNKNTLSLYPSLFFVCQILNRSCLEIKGGPEGTLVKVSDWNSFRTNQIHSDSFRNLFPRQSELIRVNPKKLFNLVWCNSVKNQSVSIRVNPRFLILTKIQSESIRLNPRLPIRMNPKEVFNPNKSEVRVI